MNLVDPPPTALQVAPVSKLKGGPICRWRISEAATAITVLVVLAVATVLVLPSSRGTGLSTFTVEHVRFLSMTDTGAQRLADRVGLILLLVFCVIASAAIRQRYANNRLVTKSLRLSGNFFKRWSGVFCAAAAALVLVFHLPGTVFPPARHGLLVAITALSASLTVFGLVWMQRQEVRASRMATWSFVAAYVLFLTAPGLVRAPVVFEPDLSWAEWHYSATLAQADRLAKDFHLGSQVNLNYGLVHSLVIGVFERTWGLLDFGGHFRLVQVFQIAFLGVAVLAFYLWRPRSPLFVLFATLLVGPWVSTSHVAMFYPNQTGWRSIGLAAGVAILLMCRQSPSRTALILGAAASFLVLYNPETGLCVTFGYGLFLLSRRRNLALSHLANLALRAAVGATVVLFAVPLFFRAGMGSLPPLEGLLIFRLIGRFGQGYGGRPLYFDPLALLILVHSIYIFSSNFLKWRARDLEFDESVKLGISAMILTWSAYFVNRPHAWNLWTFQFLYVFLLADLVNPRLLHRLSRLGIATAVLEVRIAALIFILFPMLLFVNYSILLATVSPTTHPEVTLRMLSGIFMPEDSVESIRRQAGFLATQEADTLFFSCHSYSLSLLTARFNPLPVQDAFAETVTNADFEKLVAEILKTSPRVILFDDPERRPLGAENRVIYHFNMDFFERLKARLAKRYNQVSIMNGWQVWQLQLPQDNPEIPRENSDRPRTNKL
jgi:hypothetical protein